MTTSPTIDRSMVGAALLVLRRSTGSGEKACCCGDAQPEMTRQTPKSKKHGHRPVKRTFKKMFMFDTSMVMAFTGARHISATNSPFPARRKSPIRRLIGKIGHVSHRYFDLVSRVNREVKGSIPRNL